MMKRIIVAGLTLAVLASCNRAEPEATSLVDPGKADPVAAFSYSVSTFGSVSFVNESENAIAYRWDFGDNNGKSIEENPSYTYSRSGTYTVTLSVSNGYTTDVTEQQITCR